MRIVQCHRYHAVLVVPPRGVHGKEATVTVWVAGGGTTLYLLPGLVVSTVEHLRLRGGVCKAVLTVVVPS